MEELKPGASEDVGELVRVVQETARDLLILGVEAEGEIGSQHRGLVLLVGIVGVGNDQVVRLGNPLVGASWGLGQLPVVLEEVLEVLVGPLGRRASPSHLQT